MTFSFLIHYLLEHSLEKVSSEYSVREVVIAGSISWPLNICIPESLHWEAEKYFLEGYGQVAEVNGSWIDISSTFKLI